jgi:hypothetical protein
MKIVDRVLSDGESEVLQTATPASQNARLGDRLQLLESRGLHIQKVSITADATGAKAFTAEVSGEIVDMWAIATASNASATATVRRSTTALSSAMVCATIGVPGRTTLVLQAGKTLVKDEALNVIANGAADRADVFIAILRS